MAADSSAAEGLASPSLPVEGTSVGVGTFCRWAMGCLLACAPVCRDSHHGVGNGMSCAWSPSKQSKTESAPQPPRCAGGCPHLRSVSALTDQLGQHRRKSVPYCDTPIAQYNTSKRTQY